MEIRQLRYFLAVAAAQNFTRAAKRCHVAQPSLSQQIAALEEELGEPLFHRNPRAVTLTDAGKQLFSHAERIVEETETIQEVFASRRGQLCGTIRLGVIPTVAPYILPPLLDQFRKDLPHIRLEVNEAQTQMLTRAISAGDVDLAIVADLDSAEQTGYSVHVTRLFEERLILGVPATSQLAARSSVKISEIPTKRVMHLREGHCLRDKTVKICHQDTSASTIECEQLATLAALVCQGFGAAIFPETCIPNLPKEGIRFLKLQPEMHRTINLMKKRGGNPTAVSQAFERYLKEADLGKLARVWENGEDL